MHTDTFKGKWNQLKGRIKPRWSKVTNNDLTRIDGQSDELLGVLQERYGMARDRAEKELDEFCVVNSVTVVTVEDDTSSRNRSAGASGT